CRCPGGILVECAATAEGAFARDEPIQELGQHLLLPPWFEEKRAEIVAMLEPITVPESNQTVGTVPGAVAPSTDEASAADAGIGPSRRKAVFIGGDASQNK